MNQTDYDRLCDMYNATTNNFQLPEPSVQGSPPQPTAQPSVQGSPPQPTAPVEPPLPHHSDHEATVNSVQQSFSNLLKKQEGGASSSTTTICGMSVVGSKTTPTSCKLISHLLNKTEEESDSFNFVKAASKRKVSGNGAFGFDVSQATAEISSSSSESDVFLSDEVEELSDDSDQDMNIEEGAVPYLGPKPSLSVVSEPTAKKKKDTSSSKTVEVGPYDKKEKRQKRRSVRFLVFD